MRSIHNPGADQGAYAHLVGTLGDGLLAFCNDLRNQGVPNDTLLPQLSEFGPLIGENGTQGTAHGAAGIMMAMGGPCVAVSAAPPRRLIAIGQPHA